MASIKFSNFTYGYPKHFEVSVDDFEIPAHKSILSVVGKNGSGKSTLLKTIACALPSLSGDVLIDEKKLSSYSKKKRFSSIAFLDFKINIPPFLKVIQYLENSFYLQTGVLHFLNKEQKNKIEKLSLQFEIHSLLQSPLAHLSDGQKQRVFLCGALLKDPAALLLDEPNLYLDMQQKENLIGLLKNLDKTIILSSHDFDFTQELASDYLVIKNKRARYAGALPKDDLIEILKE